MGAGPSRSRRTLSSACSCPLVSWKPRASRAASSTARSVMHTPSPSAAAALQHAASCQHPACSLMGAEALPRRTSIQSTFNCVGLTSPHNAIDMVYMNAQ